MLGKYSYVHTPPFSHSLSQFSRFNKNVINCNYVFYFIIIFIVIFIFICVFYFE